MSSPGSQRHILLFNLSTLSDRGERIHRANQDRHPKEPNNSSTTCPDPYHFSVGGLVRDCAQLEHILRGINVYDLAYYQFGAKLHEIAIQASLSALSSHM